MKLINDNIKPVLALLVILLGFAYFFSATFLDVKVNDQILIAIVGSMSVALNYYFGASTGSSKKDDVISNLAEKK